MPLSILQLLYVVIIRLWTWVILLALRRFALVGSFCVVFSNEHDLFGMQWQCSHRLTAVVPKSSPWVPPTAHFCCSPNKHTWFNSLRARWLVDKLNQVCFVHGYNKTVLLVVTRGSELGTTGLQYDGIRANLCLIRKCGRRRRMGVVTQLWSLRKRRGQIELSAALLCAFQML